MSELSTWQSIEQIEAHLSAAALSTWQSIEQIEAHLAVVVRLLNQLKLANPPGLPDERHPCDGAVCRVLRYKVIPAAPSQEPDPWAMEPGDCQRALAEIWDTMKDSEEKDPR